ncbi:MAG: transposase [Firmicutes bacterium]|nr:transposase [Bacillota bacterium]
MDETFLKIKGKNAYLYKAVDSQGNTIDFFVSEHRDKDAAKKFFKKALKVTPNQQPRVITTAKYAATEVAIHEMIYSGALSVKVILRKIKYLNKIIDLLTERSSQYLGLIVLRLLRKQFVESK